MLINMKIPGKIHCVILSELRNLTHFMNGKIDYATLKLGSCLEIYCNACAIKSAQNHFPTLQNCRISVDDASDIILHVKSPRHIAYSMR